MKLEKEITVKVNCDYDSLDYALKSQNFKIVEEYQLNDIYLLPKNTNIKSLHVSKLLQSCILIREEEGITKKLVYKYKKYNDQDEILEQGKVQCAIENINDALKFMEKIDYISLFEIKDKCVVYCNDKIELVVQHVNDKYLFIELEDSNEHIEKKYKTIEEMKYDLLSLNLDCDYSNFFVRKAEIVFNDEYKRN